MQGSGRAGVSRGVRLQAIAVAVVVAADGIVAYALGAPGWIAPLYVGLGLALALVRIRFGRERPVAVEAESDEPSPVTEPPAMRAVGYVCVAALSNADQREQTAAIKACCDERGLRFDLRRPRRRRARAAPARPALQWALSEIAERRADTLVVAASRRPVRQRRHALAAAALVQRAGAC